MPPDLLALTRRLWVATLVSNSLWLGFMAGAVLSARIFTPMPEGGGTVVAGSAFGGAAICGIAATVAARRAPHRVRALALSVLVLAAASALYIALRYQS
jgi:hypothetical protein